MRILIIHESPYDPGRWERLDITADGLRELGHDVAILSLGTSHCRLPWVLEVDISNSPLLRIINELVYRFSLRILGQFGYLLGALAILREYRPDAVIYHYSTSGLFLYMATRLWESRPLLVFDWNDLSSRMTFWPKSSGLRYRVARWLEEDFVSRISHCFLVVTEFAKELLSGWGFPSERIFVLNELVSLEPYVATRESIATLPRNDGENTLVWHGFIRPYQVPGLETAIRALDLLRENGLQCQLMIIGRCEKTEDEERLRVLASSREGSVHLKGPLKKEKLRSQLLAADVGLQLLPNALFARFINGVKLAEYLCAGLPVVVSNVEGPLELVRGNGLVAKELDENAVAEGIATALGPMREQLAARSKEIAGEEFSKEAIERKVKMLSDFLEERPNSPYQPSGGKWSHSP